MRTRSALIVKAGSTLETVKAAFGDFDRMFLHPLESTGAELVVVRAHEDEPLPPSDRFDALIITGSPHSVTERAPWADRLAAWTSEAIDRGSFVLGVCYGHQLIAHARGGRVDKNPKGYEVGCVEVTINDRGLADPLLGHVARGRTIVRFNSTHQDIVAELPKEARVLATSAMSSNQAFAIGERVWGVQFHPEFNEQVMGLYVEGRTPLIERDAALRGIDPSEAVARAKRTVQETPEGPELLRRFVDLATSR
jgi:GMP synthase (glutamine-hydrolysing)